MPRSARLTPDASDPVPGCRLSGATVRQAWAPVDPPLGGGQPADWRIVSWRYRAQSALVMDRSRPNKAHVRTLVNPRPEAIRLILSDGREQIVGPWGVAVLPDAAKDGQPLQVVSAYVLQRRAIPGLD